MQHCGLTFEKLMEWKRKSYFLIGKALYNQKEYENAIIQLEIALRILERYHLKDTTSGKSDGEDSGKNNPLSGVKSETDRLKIKELIQNAKKIQSQILKKQKSTWSKAFKENETLLENEEKEATAATARVETEINNNSHTNTTNNTYTNGHTNGHNLNDGSHTIDPFKVKNSISKYLASATTPSSNTNTSNNIIQPKKGTNKVTKNDKNKSKRDNSWLTQHAPWVVGIGCVGVGVALVYLMNRKK